MQQHHRSHPPPFRHQLDRCLLHPLDLQGPDFISLCIQPSRHLNHLRMQGRGFPDIQHKKLRPSLVPDAQEITKALGDKEDNLCPFLLQKRIGAARGAQAHLNRW